MQRAFGSQRVWRGPPCVSGSHASFVATQGREQHEAAARDVALVVDDLSVAAGDVDRDRALVVDGRVRALDEEDGIDVEIGRFRGRRGATGAEARKRHLVCEDDAYQSTILEKLTAAVRGRNTPYFRGVIRSKAVLMEQMGQNLAFQEILGTFTNTNGEMVNLSAALGAGVVFYAEAAEIYGNMSKLEFKKNGDLTIWTLHVSDNGKGTWTAKAGKWRADAVDTSRVIIDGRGFRLTRVGVDYSLVNKTPMTEFNSTPSECAT